MQARRHPSRPGPPEFEQGSASALSMKWSGLHDAASAVAVLAGEQPALLGQRA